LRNNLILINPEEENNIWDNTYSSDDDIIHHTTGKYDKEPREKRLSDQLIDEYMDDIIAGLHKQ